MDINNANGEGNVQSTDQQQQQGKKCHGNRRNQRFARKCREQKMEPTKIAKLIKKRNRMDKKYQRNNRRNVNEQTSTSNNETGQKGGVPLQQLTTTNLNKRKRDRSSQQGSTVHDTMTKSMSEFTTGQVSSKKMKNMATATALIHPTTEMKNTHAYHRYVFNFI